MFFAVPPYSSSLDWYDNAGTDRLNIIKHVFQYRQTRFYGIACSIGIVVLMF